MPDMLINISQNKNSSGSGDVKEEIIGNHVPGSHYAKSFTCIF